MQTDQYTLDEKMLEVGNGHQLYTQLWGNTAAEQTIVFLHGGPGSGCNDGQKKQFNPLRQRVIFFDQRGSGRSLPHGSLQHNTTDMLVADINKVTAAYNVETFVLTGGSWGSCLALAYAVHYPTKVTRMVLRGIFTGRKSEIDFLDKGEVRTFFPDVWDRFAASVPEEFSGNPSTYHQQRIFNNDQEAIAAALAYSDLEGSLVTLDDRAAVATTIDLETFDPAGVKIENHYLVNRCFMTDGYLIEKAPSLTMPIALVQGRYDMVCPPITAYELDRALPNSQLYWTVAGHSGGDRANVDMVRALLADVK